MTPSRILWDGGTIIYLSARKISLSGYIIHANKWDFKLKSETDHYYYETVHKNTLGELIHSYLSTKKFPFSGHFHAKSGISR